MNINEVWIVIYAISGSSHITFLEKKRICRNYELLYFSNPCNWTSFASLCLQFQIGMTKFTNIYANKSEQPCFIVEIFGQLPMTNTGRSQMYSSLTRLGLGAGGQVLVSTKFRIRPPPRSQDLFPGNEVFESFIVVNKICCKWRPKNFSAV